MFRIPALPFLAAIICSPLLSFGQDAPAAPGNTPPAASAAPMQPGAPVALTADERQILVQASQKARLDPAVIAADAKRQAAMKAARAAVLLKDQSLAPLFKKIDAAGSPAPGATPLKLTPAEREQLIDAREAMEGTPEATALEKATSDYRDTLRRVMAAGNPVVADILSKLPAPPIFHPAAASPSPAAASPSP